MKKIMIFLCIIMMFLISGCTKETIDESKLNIVTSFYPMYIATLNITDGVEDVEVKNLTSETTGCLHDYQITTSDMIKLKHADVLVINGGGMENFIDKAISLYPELTIVDASKGITIEHEEEEDEINSHYWVSISLHIEQIKNIKDELIRINPENAEKYEKNAEEYIAKLEVLKQKMHDAIDESENKNIVTFHEAFYYFAQEFDLNVVAVIEREPGTYPSSKDVAQIIDLVKEKDVTTIFIEPQYSRSAADTIARETNAKVYTLDPIVSGNLDKNAYIDIMELNLSSLKLALDV